LGESRSSSSSSTSSYLKIPKDEKAVLAVIQRHVDALNMQLASVNAYGQQYRLSRMAKEQAHVLLQLLRDVVAGKLQPPEGFGVEAEAAMVLGFSVGGGGSGGGAGGGAGRRVGKKHRTEEQERERREKMIKKFSAKNQVYENCRMLSQSGELLCYCDGKKLAWYLERGIAEKVAEEPPTIRLLFEHKSADQQAGLDGFYSQSKTNQCVVCGEDGHYLR
jgi:cation-transporting P-type ATPase D